MAEKGKLSSGEKKKKAVSEYVKMATDPNKGFEWAFLLKILFILLLLGLILFCMGQFLLQLFWVLSFLFKVVKDYIRWPWLFLRLILKDTTK